MGVLLPPPLLLPPPPPACVVLYRLLELFLEVLLWYDCNRRKGTTRWYMRCTVVASVSCNSQLHLQLVWQVLNFMRSCFELSGRFAILINSSRCNMCSSPSAKHFLLFLICTHTRNIYPETASFLLKPFYETCARSCVCARLRVSSGEGYWCSFLGVGYRAAATQMPHPGEARTHCSVR